MTIAIFGNTGKRETIEEVNRLLAFMQPHGVRILLSAELRNELYVKQTMEGKSIREDYPLYTPDTTEDIDFALSIGGDGTFLTTAMQVVQKDIPSWVPTAGTSVSWLMCKRTMQIASCRNSWRTNTPSKSVPYCRLLHSILLLRQGEWP